MTITTIKEANTICEQLGRLNVDEKRIKECGSERPYDLIEHMSEYYGARKEFAKFRELLLAKIAKRRKQLEDQLSKL